MAFIWIPGTPPPHPAVVISVIVFAVATVAGLEYYSAPQQRIKAKQDKLLEGLGYSYGCYETTFRCEIAKDKDGTSITVPCEGKVCQWRK